MDGLFDIASAFFSHNIAGYAILGSSLLKMFCFIVLVRRLCECVPFAFQYPMVHWNFSLAFHHMREHVMGRFYACRRAEFDMKNGTLRLIFQKDRSSDVSECRDVRQLSGGEKSYTTLAMLLALGKCHECPFRYGFFKFALPNCGT